MTEQILRCPHCVQGDHFQQMLSCWGGLFVCNKCGHTADPKKPDFKCFCHKCGELNPEPVRAQMRAVAIKKSSREKVVGLQEMGTLRCDGCGEEFFIGHNPASVDKWVAERQAKWLEKVLAEEHERDKKHPDRLELPE